MESKVSPVFLFFIYKSAYFSLFTTLPDISIQSPEKYIFGRGESSITHKFEKVEVSTNHFI